MKSKDRQNRKEQRQQIRLGTGALINLDILICNEKIDWKNQLLCEIRKEVSKLCRK